MRATPLSLAFLVLVGCGSSDKDASLDQGCNDIAIAASAVPVPETFELRVNELREPEGCGAGYKRHLVYIPTADSPDALADFTTRLRSEGWPTTECVTTSERCFRRNEWFIAATAPSEQRLEGYPSPVGSGPQILAVIQRD